MAVLENKPKARGATAHLPKKIGATNTTDAGTALSFAHLLSANIWILSTSTGGTGKEIAKAVSTDMGNEKENVSATGTAVDMTEIWIENDGEGLLDVQNLRDQDSVRVQSPLPRSTRQSPTLVLLACWQRRPTL